MSSVAPPIVGESVAYAPTTQTYAQQEYTEAPRRDYLAEEEHDHEKRAASPVRPPPAAAADEDEEDEDMDQLIAELESADGAVEEEEEGSNADGISAKPVPEELLQTDTRTGLSDSEVSNRMFLSL